MNLPICLIAFLKTEVVHYRNSARPETIDYMRKNGTEDEPDDRGPNSIRRISFLQSFDIVVHPRCVHTIDELSRFSYKTDRLTKSADSGGQAQSRYRRPSLCL